MPLGNWSVEWLNLNSQRQYPLYDWATGIDSTGTFTLPADFLVEMDLPVPASIDVNPGKFYLLSLGIYPSGALLTIGYDASGTPLPVATAQISRGALNQPVPLQGLGIFYDSLGKIVVGSFASIDLLPPGYYTFTPDSTRLDADVIRPQLRGVSSITLVNGTDRSVPLTGDVELVAGSNIRLTLIAVPGSNPQIRIDAISGEGLTMSCDCSGQISTLQPITRINGVGAAPDGSFNLVGGACIETSATQHGLSFQDTCATPCCGCAELETITKSLTQYKSQMTTFSDFLTRLDASVTEMDAVILGSKLGDRGCVTC